MPVLPNAMHERFAQEVASGKSAAAAYVAAGYAKHEGNCSRLRGNDKVSDRIAEIQGVGAEKAGLTVQWVLESLKFNHDRAMQAEKILDAKGQPTGEYRYEGSVANKALELIGKHLGMFKDGDQKTSVVLNFSSGDADL